MIKTAVDKFCLTKPSFRGSEPEKPSVHFLFISVLFCFHGSPIQITTGKYHDPTRV